MAIQTVYFGDQIINQSLFKECFQCKLLKFPSEFYYPGSRRCKKCTIQNQTEKHQKKRALELETHQRFLEENNLIGKKKCPQCNQWKDPGQFSFNSRTLDKLDCWCRDCKSRHCLTRYYGAKEKEIKEHPGQKKCTKCGGWKDPKEFKTSTIWCYDCRLKFGAEDCPENKQLRKELEEKQYQKWLKDNNLLDKKQCSHCKEWRNPKEFYKDKSINDGYNIRCKDCNKLTKNISKGIHSSLKNGSGKRNRHWESLVPYNLSQLKKHLIKTIPIGYSWQDFLDGKLHIDHIIPINAFNFTKTEDLDFQRCWALLNLRFLPAFENMSKGAKILSHFQTCFRI